MKSSGGTWIGFTFQLLLLYPQTHPGTAKWAVFKIKLKKKHPDQTIKLFWLPDHVSNQVEILKFYSTLRLGHNCENSHRLIKQFQRKHYLIFFFNPIWLPNHVTYHLFLNKLVQCTPMAWGTFV